MPPRLPSSVTLEPHSLAAGWGPGRLVDPRPATRQVTEDARSRPVRVQCSSGLQGLLRPLLPAWVLTSGLLFLSLSPHPGRGFGDAG